MSDSQPPLPAPESAPMPVDPPRAESPRAHAAHVAPPDFRISELPPAPATVQGGWLWVLVLALVLFAAPFAVREPEPVAVEAVKAALARYAWAVVQKDPYAYLPVYNLVTLSLDDPAGYRGAAHRRATEQCHRLTAESASPGFLPGELRPGQWQAACVRSAAGGGSSRGRCPTATDCRCRCCN